MHQTTTDSQGEYEFTGVPVGDYVLRFTVPAGFELPSEGEIEVTVRVNQVTVVPGFSLTPLGEPEEDMLFLPRAGK